MPLLLPGERTSTSDEPARSLYTDLTGFDRRSGVTDANLMIGYVWADTVRATAAAVVTGTDSAKIRIAADEIARNYWEARAGLDFGVRTEDLSTCLDIAASVRSWPVILADSGDNPTGGGVGDRADVLHAVLDRRMKDVVFAGIADAPATRAAVRAGEGSEVRLSIGGSLGSDCKTVDGTAIVERVIGTDTGLEAMVSLADNHIILTEIRRPFHRIADFRRFGIEPQSVRVVVVKSGYLSPELAPLANPALMALTDGAVNQDIVLLENKRRIRPVWPFQKDFQWQPASRLSARAP